VAHFAFPLTDRIFVGGLHRGSLLFLEWCAAGAAAGGAPA
jgi:hypothetical protein